MDQNKHKRHLCFAQPIIIIIHFLGIHNLLWDVHKNLKMEGKEKSVDSYAVVIAGTYINGSKEVLSDVVKGNCAIQLFQIRNWFKIGNFLLIVLVVIYFS